MKITSVLNIKGGTAKSLTAEIIGRSYASIGRKTLLVDADGQGDLSDMILPNVDFEESNKTLVQLLEGKREINECIWNTDADNLFLLPSNLDLFDVIYQLQGTGGSDFVLTKKLRELDFDEIVIDNNPQINKMTYNAIYAADEIICTTSIGKKTLKGVKNTRRTVVKSLNNLPFDKPLKFTILLTMIGRNNINKDISKQLRELYGDSVLKTEIRWQQKPIQDAEFNSKSLLDYDSGVSNDYKAMFEELLEREGK